MIDAKYELKPLGEGHLESFIDKLEQKSQFAGLGILRPLRSSADCIPRGLAQRLDEAGLWHVPDRTGVGSVLYGHLRSFGHLDIKTHSVVGRPTRCRNLDDTYVIECA